MFRTKNKGKGYVLGSCKIVFLMAKGGDLERLEDNDILYLHDDLRLCDVSTNALVW
jgi:hypothetical protein